jgi:membrane protein YdbS with pleckstrin-like domain
MKLTPPKQITFWIAVVLGLLGLIATFVSIPFVSGLAFWFVFVGFALLAVGLLVKGL